MLSFLLFLQAAGISMPEADARFMRQRMPRNRQEIMMTFFVDPEGRVLECGVDYPEVDERREERYCDRTIGERLGDPATGRDGEPTHGTITLSILRRTSSDGSSPRLPARMSGSAREADMEILVSRMPGDEDRRSISLLADIDADGHVQGCGQLPNADFDLSSVACSQATAHSFAVRTGADGQPVSYVDVLRVDFVVDTAAD